MLLNFSDKIHLLLFLLVKHHIDPVKVVQLILTLIDTFNLGLHKFPLLELGLKLSTLLLSDLVLSLIDMFNLDISLTSSHTCVGSILFTIEH